MTQLWRGVLSLGVKNQVHVEHLLGARICARGGHSTRRRGEGIFASTLERQAMDYADNDRENLRQVLPLPGARLTWLSGTADAMLDLESHLKDQWWSEAWHHKGIDCEALLRDAQGDIDTLDTYLSMGREVPRISAMIDGYLDTLDILEALVASDDAWQRAIATHKGEVWISGPCQISPADTPHMRAA